MKDDISLRKYKLNNEEMYKLGFKKVNDIYKYETQIINGEFLLTITIDQNNTITSDIIELSTNEAFILYNVQNSKGEFVGKMRSAYEEIINEVKSKCSKSRFIFPQTLEVINYLKETYNDEPEFLWKNDDNAAVRNKKNNKWYAAFIKVDKSKLGINEDGLVEIMDLMLEPEKMSDLVDNKNYFPGYHMNKKHWFTIILDNRVNIEDICKHIDNSYNLSISKK